MKNESLSFEQEEFGKKILYLTRNELCARYPFLNGAFAALKCEKAMRTDEIGTDGEVMEVNPFFLIKRYADSPAKVKRGYLHILLHCLYLHPFRGEKENRRLWNLACDLAVELLVTENFLPDSWKGTSAEDEKREECLSFFSGGVPSAERICTRLQRGETPVPIEELETLFTFDDHRLWYGKQKGKPEAKRQWERLFAYTTQGKERQKHRIGTAPGNREEELDRLYRSRYDYRRFLKRFAFSREELLLDEESFDYIFYSYGMEHYRNIPLIEPLEYKEVNRLEELVIAIDTSGSCSREAVQRFLGETYQILSTRENFFKKMKVYIIQCDCCIQDVAVIHSEEEWKEYMRTVKIQGRSGTDFRPVFRFIKAEQEKKNLKALKALLYFTDGDGIYPGEKPDYETAFVFVKKTDNMKFVPAWAYRLIIG